MKLSSDMDGLSKNLGDSLESVRKPVSDLESPSAGSLFQAVFSDDKSKNGATHLTHLLTDSLGQVSDDSLSLKTAITDARKHSHLADASVGLCRRSTLFESVIPGLHPRASIAQPVLHASDYIGEASIFSCVASLTNTSLGAGILGLPYAISKLGLLLGFLVLCIVCVMTASLVFLSMAASKTMVEGTTFSDISWKTFPNVMKVIDTFNAIGCTGVCIAYLVVVGDAGPHALGHIVEALGGNSDSVFLQRNAVIAMFSVALLPVIRARYLDNMKIASVFAMLCFAYLVVITFVYAAIPSFRNQVRDNAPEDYGADDWFWFPHSTPTVFVSVLPIVTLAFNCVPNAICLTHELKDNTFKRLSAVIGLTMLGCLTVYVVVGVSVYFTFGRVVQSDFLLNYPTDMWVFTVARLALAFAVCMSYPVVIYVVREAVSFIVLKRSALDSETTAVQFYALTYGIFAVTFLAAMVTSDLGIVVALAGVFASIGCTFIVPGLLFWYRCTPKGGPSFYSPTGDSSSLLGDVSPNGSFACDHSDSDHSSLSSMNDQTLSDGVLTTDRVKLKMSPSGRKLMSADIVSPSSSLPNGDVCVKMHSSAKDQTGVGNLKATAKRSRLVSVYEARRELWNVWPNWMMRFAMFSVFLGTLMVPLFCSAQFI